MKIPKVEIPEKGWSKKIIDNIVWGDSHFNPSKEVKFPTPLDVDINPSELKYDGKLPEGVKVDEPY